MMAKIDRSGCIGCGLCAETCPQVFEIDHDNLATVICNEIPAGTSEDAKEAVDNCPVLVISIE